MANWACSGGRSFEVMGVARPLRLSWLLVKINRNRCCSSTPDPALRDGFLGRAKHCRVLLDRTGIGMGLVYWGQFCLDQGVHFRFTVIQGTPGVTGTGFWKSNKHPLEFFLSSPHLSEDLDEIEPRCSQKKRNQGCKELNFESYKRLDEWLDGGLDGWRAVALDSDLRTASGPGGRRN